MQSLVPLAISDELEKESKYFSAKRTSGGSSLKIKKHIHSQSMLTKMPTKKLRDVVAPQAWTLLTVDRTERKSSCRKKAKKGKHAYFY
jgi:hypothetical protein